MIILPRILNFRKKADEAELRKQAASLADKYSLDGEETELVISHLKGMSNKAIAYENKVTLTTVKHRLHAIYRKCGIGSRAELFNKVN